MHGTWVDLNQSIITTRRAQSQSAAYVDESVTLFRVGVL